MYCNLFAEAGLMPKKRLARFIISPEAALPPGTPLSAGHFVVGQAVDVYGKTYSSIIMTIFFNNFSVCEFSNFFLIESIMASKVLLNAGV